MSVRLLGPVTAALASHGHGLFRPIVAAIIVIAAIGAYATRRRR
jgi:hypothetical protein